MFRFTGQATLSPELREAGQTSDLGAAQEDGGVPVSLGNEELRSQSGHHSSGGRGEVLHLHVGREDGRRLWTSSEGPAGADWRGGRPSLHLLHIPGERI